MTPCKHLIHLWKQDPSQLRGYQQNTLGVSHLHHTVQVGIWKSQLPITFKIKKWQSRLWAIRIIYRKITKQEFKRTKHSFKKHSLFFPTPTYTSFLTWYQLFCHSFWQVYFSHRWRWPESFGSHIIQLTKWIAKLWFL